MKNWFRLAFQDGCCCSTQWPKTAACFFNTVFSSFDWFDSYFERWMRVSCLLFVKWWYWYAPVLLFQSLCKFSVDFCFSGMRSGAGDGVRDSQTVPLLAHHCCWSQGRNWSTILLSLVEEPNSAMAEQGTGRPNPVSEKNSPSRVTKAAWAKSLRFWRDEAIRNAGQLRNMFCISQTGARGRRHLWRDCVKAACFASEEQKVRSDYHVGRLVISDCPPASNSWTWRTSSANLTVSRSSLINRQSRSNSSRFSGVTRCAGSNTITQWVAMKLDNASVNPRHVSCAYSVWRRKGNTKTPRGTAHSGLSFFGL